MMNRRMELTTPVSLPEYIPKIRYGDALTLIGSCFTEHIGQKLLRYKYEALINPFGILYHPVAMAVALERIADLKFYSRDELIYQDDLWHSLDHHGIFSGKNPDQVLYEINSSLEHAHHAIQKSSILFLSPGTANVFIYRKTGAMVANCHKIPQPHFERRRLSIEECVMSFRRMREAVYRLQPHARIIWTVSPVRHLRDGLVENQRSKATLILGLDVLLREDGSGGYFPAYEIMTDELRDYRYYARDLTHPSPLAVDLMWEKFADTYLDPHDTDHHGAIESLRLAMEHRFLKDDRTAIKKFAAAQLQYIDQLASRMPDLDWQKERQYFFHILEED